MKYNDDPELTEFLADIGAGTLFFLVIEIIGCFIYWILGI